MIDLKTLITTAGLPIRQSRFDKPPANRAAYTVLFDTEELIGPDFYPGMLRRHAQTVELYDYKVGSTSKTALETALAGAGLEYTRGDTEWLREEQVYQTIYTMTQFEKRS